MFELSTEAEELLANFRKAGGYRPTVVLAIFNNGEILLAKAALDPNRRWSIPQGGINPDETVEMALFRVAGKELAVAPEELREARFVDCAQLPLSHIDISPGHQGKTYFLCYAEFTGDRERIEPDPESIAENRWVKPKEALDLLSSNDTQKGLFIRHGLHKLAEEAGALPQCSAA